MMWPKYSHFFCYVHTLIIVIIIIVLLLLLEYSNPKINKNNQKSGLIPFIYSGATIIRNFLLLKVRKEKGQKK
jgi:hypothetical protein